MLTTRIIFVILISSTRTEVNRTRESFWSFYNLIFWSKSFDDIFFSFWFYSISHNEEKVIEYKQRIFLWILLIQTKFRLELQFSAWFGTKKNSVRCQINQRSITTIPNYISFDSEKSSLRTRKKWMFIPRFIYLQTVPSLTWQINKSFAWLLI